LGSDAVIVLDTHAFVWWVNGQVSELSRRAQLAIEGERSGGELVVSSISVWEIALLATRRRFALNMDAAAWVMTAEQIQGLRFVPVDNAIALSSVDLPGSLHGDPADRIIVATARTLDVPLVTKDERLLAYAHVRTIW